MKSWEFSCIPTDRCLANIIYSLFPAMFSDSFICTCLDPFIDGDGFSCSGNNDDSPSEIQLLILSIILSHAVPDPCLSQPCHVNASCTREGLLSEGFVCSCDTGLTGNGYNCTLLLGEFKHFYVCISSWCVTPK